MSGSLPFDSDKNKETIRMTLNDQLVFDLPCWKSVSNEAKDLIRGLLRKNPQDRFTIDDVFRHPWINL